MIDAKMLIPYEQINRVMALRVISAYRTVSRVAAELLARMPPIDLLARVHAETYWEIARIKVPISKETTMQMLKHNKNLMMKKWKKKLRDPKAPGSRVTEAILPVFDGWINREFGQLDYYTTRMYTGHGTFREIFVPIWFDRQ